MVKTSGLFRRRGRKVRRVRRKTKVSKGIRTSMGQLHASHGFLRMVRRLGDQSIVNGGVVGTANLSNAGTLHTQLGTSITSSFANYYYQPGSMQFALRDLVQYTDITGIADQYKFKWIKLRLWCTSSVASASSTAQLPGIWYCTDDDDATPPTSLNEMRVKTGVQFRQFYPNKPLTIFIRPKQLMAAYNGATTTSVVASPKWNNCSDVTQVHYGLKFLLTDCNLNTIANGNNFQIRIDAQACLLAKGFQ